jgi:hypothetical protein
MTQYSIFRTEDGFRITIGAVDGANDSAFRALLSVLRRAAMQGAHGAHFVRISINRSTFTTCEQAKVKQMLTVVKIGTGRGYWRYQLWISAVGACERH